MKNLYQDFLFQKHILVSEGPVDPNEIFPTLYSMASLFHIRILSGEKLARPYMIRYCARNLGEDVPDPFYRGFPESVLTLTPDQRLIDQLIHYTITYGWGLFDTAGHSVMEEIRPRTDFKEETEVKEFTIVPASEAMEILQESVSDLLAGSRPLSDSQYRLVLSYIKDFGYEIPHCGSKNTAIRLLLDTRDLQYASLLWMSDVIKLTDELIEKYYPGMTLRKLNLKNQDRKFLTGVINALFTSEKCNIRDCFEKKALWSGLLHHIHYQPVDEISARFTAAMRGPENQSVLSGFERAMAARDIQAAVSVLKRGKGSAALLRNLNYIVSRCANDEEVQFVIDQLDGANGVVLMQLLQQYASYPSETERRAFLFPKHNRLIVHTETDAEMARRKSKIAPAQAALLEVKLRGMLAAALSERLGTVYIDPDMEKIALPLQENTAQSGFGVLPKGSRIPIGAGKKIRAFTYWEKVNDIDLSVIGIDDDGRQIEFSWRTMWNKQSKAITFSGDVTSGYNGGSEFFDIDLPLFRKQMPSIRFLVFCDNVFSGSPFSACVCTAGFMMRDTIDSGAIFEPKTVQTSFTINCRSTFAYLFGLDLEAREMIWLNVARESSERVAGNTSLGFMTRYFDITKVLNMKMFFEMLATRITEDPTKADVIVSDREVDAIVSDRQVPVPEHAQIIHSYDFEKVLALMQ